MRRDDDGVFPGDRPSSNPDNGGGSQRDPVHLNRFRLPKPAQVPLRPWIVRGLLLRRQLTELIAASSTGKSIFALTLGLHIAAGRTFGPFIIDKPHRVAFLSVEEDDDEIGRRALAIAGRYGITDADLGGRFFETRIDDPPLLALADRRGVIHPTDKLKKLEWHLSGDGVEVVILDPFIELWAGSENDNAQIKGAAALLRGMIRRIDAAGILTHHTRKGIVTPGDIDAGRGGSSAGGVVRLAYTLTGMDRDQAALTGITDETLRESLVRFDRAKGNYLPKVSETNWFRFENTDIGNGDGIDPGDNVGVLVPWTPPGVLGDLQDRDIVSFQAALEREDDDGRSRYDQRSPLWAGHLLAEILEADTGHGLYAADLTSEQKAARHRMKSIIDLWIENGLLEQVDVKDEKRRPRPIIRVRNRM